MKKIFLPILGCCATVFSYSQQTFFIKSSQDRFNQAKEYFQKEQYNLAYPLFKELRENLTESDKINRTVVAQEVEYYTIVSSLKQNESNAELEAQVYADVTKNNARAEMMRFHLAEYYFRHQRFSEAIPLYENANISNLNNREVADMKFHQGYSYFTLQQFAKAKPLLDAIRQVKDDPNYIDANYYYGFIAFRDRQYNDALSSFRIVENEEQYAPIVPYYIVQINYALGKKDEAVAYAEDKLKNGKSQFYDLELRQLLGHAYFEKKQYAKALPYLEEYVSKSKKVRREDLYELSYSYYKANNYPKAIEGFKQLSGKEDSLSQHAMYLLADAYLKTGQKANARNAFLFSSSNNSDPAQKEISRFNYAKLSFELGYQDEALKNLQSFLNDYPNSQYRDEATELLVGALTITNNYRDALTLLESIKNPTQAVKRFLPRILYGRATELINDGRLPEAEALLDRALKDPNNASVLPYINFWKGELAYRNNKIDDAIRYYNAYLSAGAPASGEANERSVKYNLGYAYYRKENWPVAQTFFEPLSRGAALNSDPITQDAYVRTADVYYMNRNFSQARAMYDKAIGYSWPAEDYATFQKAMIAGISNSTEKVNALNTLIRKFPQSTLVGDANMEIANTYLAQDRFREALPYLSNIINASGNTSLKPQAYLKSGIAYYNAGDNEKAIAQYKQLLNAYPNSPEAEDALDNLKTIYVTQGRPGEYADVARSAGRPITSTAEDSLTYSAAELQYENNNTNGALQAFNDYLQRFPNGVKAVNAYFYRGEIYNSRKDFANAVSNYAEVARRAPNTFAETAILQAARLNFFELKNYPEAERYYAQLKQITSRQENRLEAMRGLLRSQYLQKKWSDAVDNAKDLIAQKGASSDDKSLANMAIGKSAQIAGHYDEALTAFKAVVAVNKAEVGAEARYEVANTWFMTGRYPDAEKAAFEVVNKSGSYDYWVTKAYILLGDIYLKQKDYFNAKATFQSIVQNSLNAELKAEAQSKLDAVTAEEAKSSKVGM
ncbi:tetratricopeptide repeat protein [Flavisolibacter ginsenosidimutans]|uniref:Tetratricopeptide repeat protein n=1 Tax=Flavisolibacter ginsenosidimutans TaxID=661481 RepID=A0A5B8UE81_9BACT|nr:tetratricopeptide repeat protein [Flavisolibacter ginsenosidimutans]QEC54655.1 tetratricopeptide repeat protein [Flavisolibacter ginsenosidimutans]